MRQLEAVLRAELELNAQRRVAVLDPIKLIIDNYPADRCEMFDLPNNPNREVNDTSTRPVAFTKELWIERSDFFEVPPPKFKRLTLGSEVRLMGAYLVRCTGVDKDEAGNVVAVHANADLETRNGNPPTAARCAAPSIGSAASIASTPRSACTTSCSPNPT